MATTYSTHAKARPSYATARRNYAVYVSTYAKYNAGAPAGAWLNLDDYADRDEFIEAARDLHANESDPEFMYQDWEGLPSALVSESTIEDEVWDYIAHGAEEGAKRAFIDITGYWDTDEFDSRYQGEWDSKRDFAEQLAEDLGYLDNIPEHLQGYFDYDAFARDLFLDGYTFENGSVFAEAR